MKIYLILAAFVFIAASTGCKKHHVLPKVTAPAWSVDNTGQYPASMTAVVEVPAALQPYVLKGDELGAFINNECRGVGRIVQVGNEKEFFILIHGSPSEQAQISFKYYTSWKSNMYQTAPFLTFTVDGNYGTADGPEILDLAPVK